MKALLESSARFFDRLQPREKLFLAVGGAIIGLVLLVKVLLPVWENYDQLAGQKQTLEADLTWLQEQREIVGKITNSCPPLRLQQQSQSDTLTQLIRRNQLQLKSLVEKGDKFLLTAESGDSNRSLQLFYQMACYGYAIDKLKINPLVNSTRFSIDLEISLVN